MPRGLDAATSAGDERPVRMHTALEAHDMSVGRQQEAPSQTARDRPTRNFRLPVLFLLMVGTGDN